MPPWAGGKEQLGLSSPRDTADHLPPIVTAPTCTPKQGCSVPWKDWAQYKLGKPSSSAQAREESGGRLPDTAWWVTSCPCLGAAQVFPHCSGVMQSKTTAVDSVTLVSISQSDPEVTLGEQDLGLGGMGGTQSGSQGGLPSWGTGDRVKGSWGRACHSSSRASSTPTSHTTSCPKLPVPPPAEGTEAVSALGHCGAPKWPVPTPPASPGCRSQPSNEVSQKSSCDATEFQRKLLRGPGGQGQEAALAEGQVGLAVPVQIKDMLAYSPASGSL